ncbi:cation diffusion facilitator family transporter [Corynebacterium mycetoides]|uniref:Cation diffusion facilitator family transporter n=2 Tax=Corynebacterium mycetoides TaxID=38302 RepID=A0A1G9L5B8_9CORY|nr:cation diffusion facilitator family transporter [Corynebacterium mycetoides]SDM16756.1 cation diffusion facilitator family transporter [Corynebacterium mycetoides]
MLDGQKLLERFMWLSIAASVATIVLKLVAAWVTGSVGFLSDAIESFINVVAAVVGLWALKISAKPADVNHNFGHAKAEYFSAQVEGSMILVASVAIIYTAVQRLIDPQPIEQAGVGLLLSTLAAALNLAVGVALVRAGKKHRSATLAADGRHLLTDVWTTAGVLVGIALVWLTGWEILDPLIALAVGINILVTGYTLLKNSLVSLLSEALPEDERLAIKNYLDGVEEQHAIKFTDVRTAAFGRERLVNVVMQVPGQWNVDRAHEYADMVEDGVDEAVGGARTIVHVEPLGTTTHVEFNWI